MTTTENSLASLKESETTRKILALIDEHASDEGYINLRNMIDELGFAISEDPLLNTTEVCTVTKNDDKTKVISLANTISFQEQNAAIAWVLAEYLLKDRQVPEDKGLSCNIFTLRSFRENRYSRTMLLATRLTMTESTIDKMSELDNRVIQATLRKHIPSEFANAAVKGHSVAFLIGNDYI